ncbi:MAG: hypothetical protein KAS32_02530 [Candidatus Peribacteraceae bacterium]|nr:hypothetical protein [Candidatus Peribacteraceae bacterium]
MGVARKGKASEVKRGGDIMFVNRIKGNVDAHLPNDDYRKAYDKMKKSCGCLMGSKECDHD